MGGYNIFSRKTRKRRHKGTTRITVEDFKYVSDYFSGVRCQALQRRYQECVLQFEEIQVAFSACRDAFLRYATCMESNVSQRLFGI